jgi:hypothetical protein
MAHVNFKKTSDLAAYGSQDVVRYRSKATKAARAAIDGPNLIGQHRPGRGEAAG